jgi:type II secretory pathway pseudopilin PulG
MKKNRGFTLLVAVVVTSMLLIIGFMLSDVATKQLKLATSNEESQHAFFAADSGLECAKHWDLNSVDLSPFATATPGTIFCNFQTIKTGSQAIPPSVIPNSVVGGGITNATSTFYLTFTKGCAIVTVAKKANGYTTIDSRGYNTCDTTSPRRYERGVSITYENKQDNDSVRKATLLKLQSAVEAYKSANGSYPNTGMVWKASEIGDPAYVNADWIPGLTPNYIPTFPRDPRGGELSQIPGGCSTGWHPAYLYKSDGTNYKILSHCSSESGYSASDPFYDPQRPDWSWQVTSNIAVTSAW